MIINKHSWNILYVLHILSMKTCVFSSNWLYYTLCLSVGRKPYFVWHISYKPLGGIQYKLHEASIPRGDVHILKGLKSYFTELWPFYLLCYGVGQGAVYGVFVIFSDSSSFDKSSWLFMMLSWHKMCIVTWMGTSNMLLYLNWLCLVEFSYTQISSWGISYYFTLTVRLWPVDMIMTH